MLLFFFNHTATTDLYTYLHTLSLHDALPIYLLDDVVAPLVVDAQHLTHAAFHAEQAPDFRVLRGFDHLVDVLGGDAVFLGEDQRIQGPADDVAPLVVALAHQRNQRLLGDDPRQDDVILGVVERRAHGRQPGSIGRVGGIGRAHVCTPVTTAQLVS